MFGFDDCTGHGFGHVLRRRPVEFLRRSGQHARQRTREVRERRFDEGRVEQILIVEGIDEPDGGAAERGLADAMGNDRDLRS